MPDSYLLESCVHINPGPQNSLYQANEKVDIIAMVERPVFRTGDINISCRSVSILETDML